MTCSEVEQAVFGERATQNDEDPWKREASDGPNHAHPPIDDGDSSDENDGGVPVSSSPPPPPAEASTKMPTDARLRGMQRARNREMVRQAGRRGTTLGFLSRSEAREEGPKRVEVVQNGKLVEASFAKGEWGVRWKS